MQTKDGRKLTLADTIDNRQEARWVAAQLEKFAGLKLDTHVAVDAVFGELRSAAATWASAIKIARNFSPQ